MCLPVLPFCRPHDLGQAQALESPLGNEYLNSTLLPILPSLSDIPSSLNGTKKDTLPPLPSQHSQDTSKPNFTLSAVPSTKRASSINPSFRHPNVGVPPAKKRLSSIGVASSHARLYKVLGDLFLLSGRSEDAQVWWVCHEIYMLSVLNSAQVHRSPAIIQAFPRCCMASRCP